MIRPAAPRGQLKPPGAGLVDIGGGARKHREIVNDQIVSSRVSNQVALKVPRC
jgi:hypothetical protein